MGTDCPDGETCVGSQINAGAFGLGNASCTDRGMPFGVLHREQGWDVRQLGMYGTRDAVCLLRGFRGPNV
jgi:hypothetical protein